MQPLRRFSLVLALAAAFLPPTVTRADPGDVIKDLSPTAVEQILQALNLDFTQPKANVYSFSLGGYKTLLFNNGKNIQFYSSFKKKTPLTRINEWNATKRYTRSYLDKQGDPVLEADLDIEGGVAPGALLEFIKKWVASVGLFTKHIGFGTPAPAPSRGASGGGST